MGADCREVADREAGEARDRPGSGRSIVRVHGADALREHLPAWERLADAALEPTPFYEPMLVLPALEAFGSELDLEFVLVYAPSRDPARSGPALCGSGSRRGTDLAVSLLPALRIARRLAR